MTYWAKVTLTVCGVLFGCYILYVLRSVAVSVLLGLFFAVGLEPAVAALERRGIRRGFAILLIFGVVLGVVAGFLLLALPPAIAQFAGLVSALPAWFARLATANPRIAELVASFDLGEQLSEFLGRVPDLLTSSLGTVLGVAGAILGGFFSLLTILVLMVYFMLALPGLRVQADRLLGSGERVRLLDEVLGKISGYITGQLAICAIAGSLAFVFLAAIRAPFPALLALVTALTVAIPLVGASIGAVLVTLVVWTDSLGKAVATFVFYLAYQQLENYVIGPRVFARAVNLPPAAVFIAVLCGGSLAGFVGAIVALPAAAAIKSVAQHALRRRGAPAPPDVVHPGAEEPAAKAT